MIQHFICYCENWCLYVRPFIMFKANLKPYKGYHDLKNDY